MFFFRKTLIKPEDYTDTKVLNTTKADHLRHSPLVQSMIPLEFEGAVDLIEITAKKRNIHFNHPVHYGLIILEESKVQFTKFHHCFIQRVLRPSSYELIGYCWGKIIGYFKPFFIFNCFFSY